MNDLSTWLHSSAAKAKFFLSDLTRKPKPDIVAVTEEDTQFTKGVIIESMREGDLGAIWWTTRDDVQSGLEMGYFDVSKERPVIRLKVEVPASAKKQERSASLSPGRAHGRSR